MGQQNDRFYEVRGQVFSFLANSCVAETREIVMQSLTERLEKRFIVLTEEEKEDVTALLESFGREVEKLAYDRRRSWDQRWTAYRRGFDDGKKNK